MSCSSASASKNNTELITDSLDSSDKKKPVSTPIIDDEVFKKLLYQESRGNQHDRNGQPLTSSKGAIGIAQVMPETAPEAARLAGLEWSKWRYRNDVNYNKALGQAYFNYQIERYEGNHVLALAAYNAGPGSVDKWLKRFGDPRNGEISNQEFIQLIPFMETQAYVASILNPISGKYSYSSKRKKVPVRSGYKVEFRDTHPSFKFNIAVNQSFNASNSRLVGGL